MKQSKSQEVNTIENIREWFRACPAVNSKKRFSVDNLGSDPTEYVIFTTPSTLISKEDILGNVTPATRQTLNFIFASREPYGRDILQNLENLGFFDEVLSWVCEQTARKNFPVIREGEVVSIMPSLTQYAIQTGTDSARYQIQCRLTYKRGGG